MADEPEEIIPNRKHVEDFSIMSLYGITSSRDKLYLVHPRMASRNFFHIKLVGALAIVTMMILLSVPLGAHAQGMTSQLTAITQDTSGQTISGYYTVLYQSSAIIGTGFTPATFTLNNAQSYAVLVDDYGSCHFDHWADTGSRSASRSMSISTNTQITAVYNCGTSGTSNVTINSIDKNGNPISGYYSALFDASGSIIGTGFTAKTFSTTAGQMYGVLADSYGSCTFNQWSDGVTSNPRSFTATSEPLSFTAVYLCGTSTTSTISVSTVDSAGSPITGNGVTLWQNGTQINSCLSPCSFTVNNGQTYQVGAASDVGKTFTHWQNDGSTGFETVKVPTTSATISLTAVYTAGSGGGSGTITVYDHRVPASYWAPCFATMCSAGTGPGASMWVALYDSHGNVVATGFADENGHTFSGLSPGSTYLVYPADCNSCHGSTHDVLFDHWGNGSTTRPLAVVANGSAVDAWYVCTNGCGGV
jgi:hypothetical protein